MSKKEIEIGEAELKSKKLKKKIQLTKQRLKLLLH